MTEEITIPRAWLERLAVLAEKAQAELENPEEKQMYIHLHQLIGYASSAKTILTLIK